MRRTLACILAVALLVSAPVAGMAQPSSEAPPPEEGGVVLFKNPEHDRRILIVGLGMVFGVVAYNYIVQSAAPMFPTVATQLAAAQTALAWAGTQLGSAYRTLAGVVGGVGATTMAATAVPTLAGTAAVGAPVGAAPAVGAGIAAPAGAGLAAAPAAAAAVPAMAVGIGEGAVNLAHTLGTAAAVGGAVAAHSLYSVVNWAFGSAD